MNSQLQGTLIAVGVVLLLIVTALLAKKRVPVRYSIFWYFASAVIILVGAVPNFIGKFTKLLGFETTSNLVIGIIVGLLLLITLLLTVIVSDQRRKIATLTQEISINKSSEKDIKEQENNNV